MDTPPEARPLTVYMPVSHGALANGIARSFARANIRMMVSGPTMTHRLPHDFPAGAGECAERFGPTASAYEGEEILAAPPDVVMVSNPANEQGSLVLTRALRRIAPVALVAYSGVYHSRYRYELYNGVVANDVPSRVIARYTGVPAIKFFPDMDFDAYPVRPEPAQDRVVLRSFINEFEQRFPLSAQFFAACREALVARFGDRVVVENISKLPREQVKRKMVETTAMLHIKDSEGFGYAILEGMATGRPLITQAGLARNMAYNEWAIPGRSHFPIDRPEDVVPLVARLLADPAWRAQVQRNAAQDVRALDFAAHAAKLRKFLDALSLLQRAPKPEPIERPTPTLDASVLQPFERIALSGEPAATLRELM